MRKSWLLAVSVGLTFGQVAFVSSHTAVAISGHMKPAVKFNPLLKPAGLPIGDVFGCQRPSDPYFCYGPAQIRKAYGIDSMIKSGGDGSGQTIVIIDAFQNPTMASDLATFDRTFHLAPPPSFTTIAPQGLTPFNPTDSNQVGWSAEIALDVEWAHVVAPNAKIVLALSTSDADAAILQTERYVVTHNIGSVISMSYGEAESCMDPTIMTAQHQLFATANDKGITLIAASGDWGAALPTCDGSSFIKAVSTPASDPHVTSIGGTQLHANLGTGAYQSEVVWNEPDQQTAGGGGYSSIYPTPVYQSQTVTGGQRGVPDVSYNASLDYGTLVAWGSSGQSQEFWSFGGTSIGAPQWAGVVAIADQLSQSGLGNINPTLYKLGRGEHSNAYFHDITSGNNDFPPFPGFGATSGWDAASGWGSPIVSTLAPALAGHQNN